MYLSPTLGRLGDFFDHFNQCERFSILHVAYTIPHFYKKSRGDFSFSDRGFSSGGFVESAFVEDYPEQSLFGQYSRKKIGMILAPAIITLIAHMMPGSTMSAAASH